MGELFLWTDGHDTVVATSAEDATALMVEAAGVDPDECGPWRRVEGPTLTIRHADEPGMPLDTRSLDEWVTYNGGRGLLASTEY